MADMLHISRSTYSAYENGANAVAILGSQYSSAGFCALLKKYNVTQSMSRAGTPRDNAVMESVFGWFKDFLKADFFPRSSEPIEVVLAKAVHEFNFHRPSHKLHYKSPVQFKLEQGFP